MAPHSSTLAWKIPWMEEPGGLQSMGSHWATSLSLSTFMHWRRKWQPTPAFLPGESQGWWSLVGCCLWGSHRVGHDWSDLAAAAFYRTQTFIEEGVPGMGTIIYRTLSWKIARKIWKQHYAQLGDTRIFDICLCKIKEQCKCKLLLCNAMCKALDFSWRHLSLGMHSLLTCIPLNTNTIKNFLSKSVG